MQDKDKTHNMHRTVLLLLASTPRTHIHTPGVVLRVPATQPCHPSARATATDARACQKRGGKSIEVNIQEKKATTTHIHTPHICL